MESVIVLIGIVIIVLLLLRAFGAWMFRIDEVIKQQKKTNNLLEKINKPNL